jgi:hypothetical protein
MDAKPVDSYGALLDVLRRRMAELDLTFDRLNDIAGLADGHSAKILAPNPTKRLGSISWSIFGALGCSLSLSKIPKRSLGSSHAWSTTILRMGLTVIGVPAFGRALPPNPEPPKLYCGQFQGALSSKHTMRQRAHAGAI